MPGPFAVVLIALATYRVARLIAVDTLTLEVRAWFYRFAWKDQPAGPAEARGAARTYLYELVTCPFCVGVWAAFALFGLWVHVRWFHWLIAVLAIAGAQAFLQSLPEDKG